MSTLHLDYRPKTLDEFYGNEAQKEALSSALSRKKEDIPRSYFITGPPGCGKTTLAHVIRNTMGVSDLDFYQYDASHSGKVEFMRKLREDCTYAATDSEYKLFLIDECHRNSPQAFDNLLKMLEFGYKHVIFVLCTSEPNRIPTTQLKAVRRRCFEVTVEAFHEQDLVALLRDLCTAEELGDYPESILQKIASVSNGSPGMAVKFLDSVIDMEDEEQILSAIEGMSFSDITVKEICSILMDTSNTYSVKKTRMLKLLQGVQKEQADDLRYGILGYLNAVFLNRKDDNLLFIMSCFAESYQPTGYAGLTLSCFAAIKED